MTKERTMYQLPAFLKLGMYVSEVIIINLIFYYFYKGILCPGSEHPFDISYQFGFMAMSLTISYILASGCVLSRSSTVLIAEAPFWAMFL